MSRPCAGSWEFTVSTTEQLETYLNDHLAGAGAGSDLARKLRSANAGTPLGAYLADLSQEIDEDKATLERIMDHLGITKNPVKQAVGRLGERFSRIKLNELVTGSRDLSRLLELEALGLGIQGKLAGWQALQAIRDREPKLAEFDLDSLISRAEQQRAGLEQHRLRVAGEALVK